MTSSYWFQEVGTPTPDGDTIGQSLRFRGQQYLINTGLGRPAGDFTVSFWMKTTVTQTDGGGLYGANTPVNGGYSIGQPNSTPPSTIRNRDGTGFTYLSDGALRDPAAWYHLVFQSESNVTTLFINGVRQSNTATTFPASGTTIIGAANSNVPDEPFLGYLADYYCIDGQVLEPTVFGEYDIDDVWKPIKPNFGKGRKRYSDDLTSSTGGFGSTQPPADAFDGITSTEARCSTGGVGTYLEFAPTTEIPFTTLEVDSASPGVQHSYDGVDQGTGGSGFVLVAENGILSKTQTYRATSTAAGTAPNISAIRVDGVILTNPNIWSGGLFTNPNADTPNYDTTETLFQTVNVKGNAFDGNPDTFASTLYDVSSGGNAGTWILWRPNSSIVAQRSIEVRCSYNSAITVNENDTGFSNPSRTTQTVDVSAALTFPVTIESIAVRGNAPGSTDASDAKLYQIIVDGQPLVDGANPSYGPNGFHLDFSDPNDIGADRSGNGNDFTPNGFDTTSPKDPQWQTYAEDWGTQYNNSPVAVFNGTASASFETWEWYFLQPSTITITGVLQEAGATAGDVIRFTVYPRTASVTCNISSASGSASGNTGAPHTVDVTVPAEGVTSCTITGNDPTYWGIGAIEVNGKMLVNNSGPDYDLMQDSPTQNYATLNPLINTNWGPNGNTTVATSYSGANLRADVAATGAPVLSGPTQYMEKIYLEVGPTIGADQRNYPGIIGFDLEDYWSQTTSDMFNVMNTGEWRMPGQATTQVFDPWFQNDIARIKYDGEAHILSIAVNNGDFKDKDMSALIPAGTKIGIGIQAYFNDGIGTINYGQQPFKYAVPDGFSASQTANMPASTILNGRDHFQAITAGPDQGASAGDRGGNWSAFYTSSTGAWFSGAHDNKTAFDGAAGTTPPFTEAQTSTADGVVTWEGFTPINITTSMAFSRSASYGDATVVLTIDGVEQTLTLPVGSGGDWQQIFTGSGTLTKMTVGGGGSYGGSIAGIQIDGETLVDAGPLAAAQQTFPNGLWWIKDRANSNNWQLACSQYDVAPTDNVVITNGGTNYAPYVAPAGDSVAYSWDLTDPTVSGVEFISDTGTGVQRTVSHNLGRVPQMIWGYNMVAPASNNVYVYHSGYGAGGAFNLANNGAPDNRTIFWGGVDPTDTEFTVGVAGSTNPVGAVYYWLWAEIPGFSAFGTYTGNGDANGPMVNVGFKPAFILTKRNGVEDWSIVDTTSNINNPAWKNLRPNQTNGEGGGAGSNDIDILSNGFKVRNNTARFNTSGNTYIYCCFAENPFSSPVTAR